MKLTLHKNARTTPAIREEIKKSSQVSYRELAIKYNVSIDTIPKWKRRDTTNDKSHTRKNLLSSLSAVEEEIEVDLRSKIGLSLDDITEVMNRCINPRLTRSAIYRTMKRSGVAKRAEKVEQATPQQPFQEVLTPGYIHMGQVSNQA